MYTCGAWSLAVTNDAFLWAWTAGGFVWRMSRGSNGWVDVFDGDQERKEWSGSGMGVAAITAATRGECAELQADVAGWPRVSMLGAPDEVLVHGNWTLTREDSTVTITCAEGPHSRYRIAVGAAGLKKWYRGELESSISLRGQAR